MGISSLSQGACSSLLPFFSIRVSDSSITKYYTNPGHYKEDRQTPHPLIMSRVWHISGANTGLGLELALKALAEGDRVIAAVRTPSKAPESLQRPDVKVLRFDLSWNQDEMNKYAKEAFGAFGQLDVLVNNAGYAYMGAVEESE